MAAGSEQETSGRGLQVRLLGPVSIRRDGAPVSLPRSRKVIALLALLALGRAPVSRSRLCSLLFDVPSDPRGELRWCLSKLRGILDDEARPRVLRAAADQIALDLSDCLVDVVELERELESGLAKLSSERLAKLRELFGGDLLEGVELDAGPEFSGWLSAQRQRYRALRIDVLRELTARSVVPGEIFSHLEAWLALAPFDQSAHESMLSALVKGGRRKDAEAHLAAAIRSYEREGVDWAPLREAWRALRGQLPQVEPVELAPDVVQAVPNTERQRRASVAVMPFADAASGEAPGRSAAAGLTDDIITRLAKLRVLFVIARGSVYALSERGIGPDEAGRILNVDYVVSGSLRRRDSRVTVLVELAEAQAARIVWTDELEAGGDDTFSVLDTIVDRVVAAIAKEIEAAECSRAILKPPSSLDAWEAYHRGLWHMYRFNGPDNQQAEQLFRRALELDPTFSRAFAGLSFTHFQNAFLGLVPERKRQIDLAFESAGQSLIADDRDPAAHWAMGRALWLRGAHDDSLVELERSIELSPNFALGHYTLGFVQSQAGDARAAIEATNTSRELSPFDPLQFGMLASRAIAHVRLGEPEEAARWALKASARPNAHVHILAIAAECLALTQRREEAQRLVQQIRSRAPSYSVADFLRSFRFPADVEQLFRQGARQIGFE